MNDKFHELISTMNGKIEELVSDTVIANNELTVFSSKEHIFQLVEFLGSDADFQFTTLIDVTAIDFPDRQERFEVVYHFLSMTQNQRIRVKLSVGDSEVVPSLVSLHPSANWFEREVFDMYGIMFSNHPDMRRILTDYGFSGYPLRKDFPTTGYVEVRYDETKKKVVYEKTKLTQDFRQFDFLSPWEGSDLFKKKIETDKG